jgi:hypothetical protein
VKWLALLFLVACAHAPPGAARRADSALVRVICPEGEATLWIDGRLVAQVRDAGGGVRLRSGLHRFEIRHDRFHTRYLELTLRAGEERELQVSLVEELD